MMPSITLIEFTGEIHTINAKIRKSLMLNAIELGILGIDADCSGAGACGNCRCPSGKALRGRRMLWKSLCWVCAPIELSSHA
jgi:hypothetical protein